MRRRNAILIALAALCGANAAADDPAAAPAQVVVAPPDSANPRFGDYVYVEELPEAIGKVPPKYPLVARKAGVDGTVLVQALVGRDGRVHDTRIVKSIPMLDTAAVEAVRQWTFKPALAKGKPVAVWVAVPVRFTLHHSGVSPPTDRTPPSSPGVRAIPPRIEMMPAPPAVPETLHVRTEAPLDVAAFNDRLAAARDSLWARSAATIAIEFVGGAGGCAQFSVDVASLPERFDQAEATVIRGGFLDDSVFGDRHRLSMRRNAAGRWRISSAVRSWRCSPGRGEGGYGIAPCR